MKKKHAVLVLLLAQLVVLGIIVTQFVDVQGAWQKIVPATPQKKVPETVTIVLPYAVTEYSPFRADDRSRLLVRNLYEPLVDFDLNLHPSPVLATSWGLLSPTVWEFNLRENAVFQNGKSFQAEDVVFSWRQFQTHAPQETQQSLSTIQDIQIVSPHKIRLTTTAPDPLLLSRLRYLFMLPGNATTEQLDQPAQQGLGSGPYRLQTRDEATAVLTKFDRHYKSEEISLPSLRFIFSPNKFTRLELLRKKEADVVLSIPHESLDTIEKAGYTSIQMPTLESVFLLFNFNGELGDPNLRTLLTQSIDRQELAQIIGGLGTSSSQFASSGVFGFNPEIESESKSGTPPSPAPLTDKLFLTLKLSRNNGVLADFLTAQLERYGVKLNPVMEDDATLFEDIASGNGHLFLVGWKFSDGDAGDFYNTFIRSRSGGLGYSLPEVDQLIDQARSELNVKKRLQLLQEVMHKITVDAPIGIPLFESYTIYASKPEAGFSPSMDGSITYQNFTW